MGETVPDTTEQTAREQVFPADDTDSTDGLPGDPLIEEMENIQAVMAQYPELDRWKPYTSPYGDGVFHITGNFFGDRDDDLAVLIISEDDSEPKGLQDCVKICIVNQGEYGVRYVVLDQVDEFRAGCGFDWVGEFKTVPAGEPLFSNWKDDFRSFDRVPEDEIVYLPYDAIFAHVADACGGGFIFWKNGRWNWLQQE
ncbi:MAG: hypothetical protein LIO77_00245 [Rikenellaceae bacterium]|nr:hypothetical protein [Rikenellaceae bacterium]